jgi:hypothetical protein
VAAFSGQSLIYIFFCDMSKEKIIFIVIAGMILPLSLFGWLSLRSLLQNSAGATGWDWLSVCLIFIFIGGLFGLLVLLARICRWLVLAFGLVGIAFLLVFGAKVSYLAGLAASFGLIFLYNLESFKEKKARVKIVVKEIIRPSLVSFFTAMALMISLVIYFSPAAQGLKDEIKIPRPLFDVFFNAITGIFKNQANDQAVNKASDILKAPGTGGINLSALNMDSVVGKILTPQAKEEIYGDANYQLNSVARKFKKYLPYSVAFGAFFALKAASFLFIILAGLLTRFFFRIFKSVKLITVGKETIEREVIEV